MVAGLLLAALALISFLPVVDNGFVNLDDPDYVSANPMVQRGLTPASIAWALTANVASNWHPLTLLSHMLDCELFGLDPRGHHLTSLILHAANAGLLFAVLYAMTGAFGRSVVVAALFAVHPTRVESVAWVAERKDVLSTFFGLLALAAYAGWCRRGGRWRYLLVTAALALGLMAKPMLVTWPFLLLLLDVWPLRRLKLFGADGDGGRSPSRRLAAQLAARVGEKLPLFALAAAASAVTVLSQGEAIAQATARPFAARLANATVAYATYLWQTLVPSGLAAYYPFRDDLPGWQVAGAAALLGGISALALALLRRAPYVAVGWFWYVGTLVPVIGLLPVGGQARADRFTYVTTVGIYLAVVWGLAELWPRRRRLLAAVAAVAVLALAAVSRAQIPRWRDSETLFRHTLAVAGASDLAHVNLAEALRAQGREEEALEHYRAAVELAPGSGNAHAALGGALHAFGRPAEALPHLEKAVALGVRQPPVFHTLALALDELGREEEALEQLRRCVEIEPRFAPCQRDLAVRLDRRGDVAGAVEHYRLALRAAPGLPLYGRLGVLLGQRGELDEAAAFLRQAVRRDPSSITDRFNLGVTLARQGNLPAAARELRAALRLAPDRTEVAVMLAQVLAAMGQRQQAIAVLEETRRLRPGDPSLDRALDQLRAQ